MLIFCTLKADFTTLSTSEQLPGIKTLEILCSLPPHLYCTITSEM